MFAVSPVFKTPESSSKDNNTFSGQGTNRTNHSGPLKCQHKQRQLFDHESRFFRVPRLPIRQSVLTRSRRVLSDESALPKITLINKALWHDARIYFWRDLLGDWTQRPLFVVLGETVRKLDVRRISPNRSVEGKIVCNNS